MNLFKKSRPSWGVLLLGAWLIATGLLHLVPRLSFSISGELLAGLAIAAGGLLLLERYERAVAYCSSMPLCPERRDRPGQSHGAPALVIQRSL